MMSSVRHIKWEDFGIAMPAFLTLAFMPFTYSIANGVSFGIISYVILNGARNLFGKDPEKKVSIHPLLWVIAILAAARYIFLAGE
jgi:AGZA family xanthine/uracil permease-like MFS transporter